MRRKIYCTSDCKGYWYHARHGVGPGTIPRDVKLIKVVEDPENSWKDYFLLDRALTTQELSDYDLKEKCPPSVECSVSVDASKRSSKTQHVYDVCNAMGWNKPMFMDAASTGYRCKWGGRSFVKQCELHGWDAESIIKEIKDKTGVQCHLNRGGHLVIPYAEDSQAIESTTSVKASTSDDCMNYYQRMSPEEEANAFSFLDDQALEDMGYGDHHILGWYEAKPKYRADLEDQGLADMMLIDDGLHQFLGYVVGDRLFELEPYDIEGSIINYT